MISLDNAGPASTEKRILGVDIGNTNTVFGLFETGEGYDIIRHWRTVTVRERTSDELGIYLIGFLQSAGIDAKSISGFIFSSVVPSFNPIVERMAHDYFQSDATRVHFEMKLPFRISYPRPFEIGADRLVNAAAVSILYPGNSIIIDMGTATTFCLMVDGVYRGGSIAPGLKLSMEALTRNTAQLPPIEFSKPPGGVLGDSTVHALQSGFFYGWVGLLREIIKEMKNSQPGAAFQTIATGGLSSLIHKESPELFDIVDPLLTLRGLKILYQQNQTD